MLGKHQSPCRQYWELPVPWNPEYISSQYCQQGLWCLPNIPEINDDLPYALYSLLLYGLTARQWLRLRLKGEGVGDNLPPAITCHSTFQKGQGGRWAGCGVETPLPYTFSTQAALSQHMSSWGLYCNRTSLVSCTYRVSYKTYNIHYPKRMSGFPVICGNASGKML